MSESTAMGSFTNMVADGLDDYTTNARGDVGSLVRIEAAKAARELWRNTVPVCEVMHTSLVLAGKGKKNKSYMLIW
jgi:hypothetical protein